VIEGCEKLRLARKPRDPIPVDRGPGRQRLHRHVVSEPRIAGAIHLAHSAFAQLRQDLIRAECAADHWLGLG
jgi:hypothetical protein